MHRPPHPASSRPDASKLSSVHSKLRRVKKPGWNDTQHDLDDYRPSAQELLEKKLRLMSKEQLMRLAGIPPPPPATQQRVTAKEHGNAETDAGSSGEDKENVEPVKFPARPPKPAKPTATAATSFTNSASQSSSAVGRASVLPVNTAAPVAANESGDTTAVPVPPAQQAAASLGYRSVLQTAALLSPVLERSIEVELDAEARTDTHTQPPADVEQQQHANEAETQHLVARIDSLTAASPARSQLPGRLPLVVTPDKRAELVVQDVAARMQQLANTPTQLPTFSPTALPPLTSAHINPLPFLAAATAPSTPSIHHRLFLLLKQVASHLESLSNRPSTEAAERASMLRQLEAKDRRIEQLQSKVQSLESGVVLVQKQLLAMQRGYDEQLASMVNALTRLEHRSAPAAAVDVEASQLPTTRLDGDGKQRTFGVPPPFVSSQLPATDQQPQQRASPASRRHRTSPAAALLLTPPRSPFVSSPMRSASSASFLASPSPPRAGRSPRRIIARWDEVSNLHHRLQAAAANETQHSQPDQLTARNTHRDQSTVSAEQPATNRVYQHSTTTELSTSTSFISSAVPVASLSESTQRSDLRSAGWPQHTTGWTVHMR